MSSDQFEETSKGFVLLRLKPGPAEAMFSITTAPNATVADWYGRPMVANINLRGDIDEACGRLRVILEDFDYEKAAEPPYEVPDWARPFVEPDGEEAVSDFLDAAHPIDARRPSSGPSFDEFVEIYRSLDIEIEMIQFCVNYIAVCKDRAPAYGAVYSGYDLETDLLKEMTFCRNDGVKFKALGGYGRFAPVSDILFFVDRAENKNVDCRNPNVLLCSCLSGIGAMAERYSGVEDRQSAQDYEAILAAIPTLIEVLDQEGRNNSACKRARESLIAVIEKTGAPEALEGYIHCFKAPHCDSQFMIDFTTRFHEESLVWLATCTGENLGYDFEAWQDWFQKSLESIYYEPTQGKFVLDADAAAAYRERLEESLR